MLITILLASLVILTLPGTFELLILTVSAIFSNRKQGAVELDTSGSSISLAIVIPAHNEEKGIIRTIESLKCCHQPQGKSDIVVIADNCTDSTASVVRKSGVRVIERFDVANRGKGYALDFAFNLLLQESYDAFVVVDADTEVDHGFIYEFRKLFHSGKQAGQAWYRIRDFRTSNRGRLMNIAYLGFCYVRPLGRKALGLSVGIMGNGFGLSREALQKIPYKSFSIVEDLQYHLELVDSGINVEFLDSTAIWGDMPEDHDSAREQRSRWEGGRLRMIIEFVPKLFVSVVIRGRLRLVEPMFELLLLPLAFHVVLLLVLLIVSDGAYAIYAIFALLTVVLHVVVAMSFGRAKLEDWKTLGMVPWYVCWKILNIPATIIASKKSAKWNRTQR